MRKLTGAIFRSLDNVIQAPGGPEEDKTSGFRFGGWVQPFWGEDMAQTIGWLNGQNIEYRLMRAPEPFLTWQLFFPDPNGVEVEIDFSPSEQFELDLEGQQA